MESYSPSQSRPHPRFTIGGLMLLLAAALFSGVARAEFTDAAGIDWAYDDAGGAAACAPPSPARTFPELRLRAEMGFLGVLAHVIQFSQSGTEFSYPRDGGQDLLFPVTRFSAELLLHPAGRLILLYQPLQLETRGVLRADLRVDDTVFPAGTPMRFFYGFPFYRASYLHDFDPSPEGELALGGSLQIRNADIEFQSLDGQRLTREANIGLVPLLKVRWRRPLGGKWWAALEADGIYAPVSYLNGSDTEIVGALLDASLRLGLALHAGREVFLNLRYLGGGAVGTNEADAPPGDGYVRNWLHFLSASLGFTLPLF